MRLHLHDYLSVDLGGIVDGAVLMHQEMASRLRRRFEVAPHDIRRGPSCLDEVRDGDVVYAGSGPYAFLYHLWRQRSGREFRIVRELHTTLWSGYWSQEELCETSNRPGDIALFPTEFTRRLFMSEFPAITEENSAVAYPMLDHLEPAQGVRRERPGRGLRIGYLGALSHAKNFDQVVEIFCRYHVECDRRSRLLVAGKPNHPRWQAESVRGILTRRGVEPEHVEMLGVLSREQLSRFFARIDVLLFPSTASRESLGRVVIECLAHGVPVLAANHGPAVELLPEENLIAVDLNEEETFSMGRVDPLGVVDEGQAVELLANQSFLPAEIRRPHLYSNDRLWNLLAGGGEGEEVPGWDRGFFERFSLAARRRSPDEEVVMDAERLFFQYFARQAEALQSRIEDSQLSPEVQRELAEIVSKKARSLADYRAFPRLLDALVLPPLSYTLRPVGDRAEPAAREVQV